jgi:4-amino-4-deoxy-L-arabinose transferase-like glycosyltransferase
VTGLETEAPGTTPRRRVGAATLALAALVLLSTGIRFGAAQAFTTPWIAPDEMVYGLIGESLWTHGTLEVRGLPTPYYSILTPALVGAPLALFDLADGVQWARLLQALAASLVAVPTYRWAVRMTSTGWALAAAALTLAAPALHYSGFLMTEPLTLTVVAAALLALARAVEEPTMWRYGVFAAWATAAAAVRLQALLLLPAFLFAVALDALAARDRARLRPLAALAGLAALVGVAILGIVVIRNGELSAESILGAYTPVGENTAAGAARLSEVAWHALDIAILGLAIPVLAIAVLAHAVFSRRDTDPALRAFVAVALAYVSLLVVQVGLFSAEYVGHVAERYLITALPLLAIGLCAWISRGAPRAYAVVLPIWALLVAGAALIPLAEIATPETLVNTFTPSSLVDLPGDEARAVLVAAAVTSGALFVAVPRRFAWTLAVVVAVGLVLASADSGRRIARASEHEDRVSMGSSPGGWLDDDGLKDTTLLVTGDRLWTATARTIFWNRAIAEVLRVANATLPFPPVTPAVELGDDGVLRTADGGTLDRQIVVAPSTVVLAGEKVAERGVDNSETYGLTAWRAASPVRVLRRIEGLLPNGDFSGRARITVFACQPGTLDVTILGKTGDPISAYVDGFAVATLETPAETSVRHSIPAPPYADGSRPCIFDLETPGYAGTTTIEFTPGAS